MNNTKQYAVQHRAPAFINIWTTTSEHDTLEEATAMLRKNYNDGWQTIGQVIELNKETL